ncbi:unnamed protein product [Spirodela intermedia]|uniref:Uroporphyrinogen decarboxylase (URO-D) domain-containing protein n=1 Tax=Spirodela intermedia TaxID=51605 RepID=A0A7I8L843_SPIIN|nr:unnamed protein product [Spirodela intermedia]
MSCFRSPLSPSRPRRIKLRCTVGEFTMEPKVTPPSAVEPLLLNAIRGEKVERRPAWLMRQAGRYMKPIVKSIYIAVHIIFLNSSGFLFLVHSEIERAESIYCVLDFALHALLRKFAVSMARYVRYQADHGAQAVQIFDSHHLHCGPVVEGGGRRKLGPDVAVQGNVGPGVLFESKEFITSRINDTMKKAGAHKRILNLGHGIMIGTPEESVDHFFEVAKGIRY